MSNKRGQQTRERVYRTIVNYINYHQYPPTVREICEIIGIKSTAAVHRHIEALKEQGLLESDNGKGNKRALRVPNQASEIDALYLAKCNEVNELQIKIAKLNREIEVYKMQIKNYKRQGK